MADDQGNNNNNNGPQVQFHPPTAICSGNPFEDSGNFDIIVDPNNPLVMKLWSKNQTAQGRPEWLFPLVWGREEVNPPDRGICNALIKVVRDHEVRGVVPGHLETVSCELFDGAFVVRRADANNIDEATATPQQLNEQQLRLALENYYLHRPCPSGILCLVPLPATQVAVYNSMPTENKRLNVDMQLQRIVEEERHSVMALEASMNDEQRRAVEALRARMNHR